MSMLQNGVFEKALQTFQAFLERHPIAREDGHIRCGSRGDGTYMFFGPGVHGVEHESAFHHVHCAVAG
eukprot:4584313-Amphidinium_carterae.1